MSFAIARPDDRPEEVKAAADQIEVGYGLATNYFRCRECGKGDWMPEFKHAPSCRAGRLLEAYTRRVGP